MRHGRRFGDEGGPGRPSPRTRVRLGIATFVRDDGGYTTIAVAVTLLLSLTLAFGLAAAEWGYARAADVQEVADACAMSGENCVAAFSTVAQVVDACVLSMGLTGVIVLGAGMIVAAIPGLQAAAPEILDAGNKILDARRDFAHSAAEGLERLETALPALIVANAASTAQANSTATISYTGVAVPYPLESGSNYSALEDNLDGEAMQEAAEQLQEASSQKEAAMEQANEARERAWRADNVDDPYCMRSRAARLAGLGDAQNPYYASPTSWRFEYALRRARNYYASRSTTEAPEGSSPDELQRSRARAAFYEYAYKALSEATCEEGENTSISLPELPHNAQMVRETSLYTDVRWPCTEEGYGRTLHCSRSCPGATGASLGLASLADIDRGLARRCDICQMDATAMGNVANASTNINNGFEHYWRIVVEASRDYQAAMDDAAEAEEAMQEAAEKSGDAFSAAIDVLAVDRPTLLPPGAYGCVGVAVRGEAEIPSTLTSAFLTSQTLPQGVATSGAVLAPDENTDGHNVLSSVFDGLGGGDGSMLTGLLGGIGDLWGSLLVGYGSAYGSVSDVADSFFDGVGGVLGERVALWMRAKVSQVIQAAGFEPADMRLRKPVLTNTQNILDAAGLSQGAQIRQFVQEMPTNATEMVQACRENIGSLLGSSGEFTVAEVPIPGLDGVSIPLTINLSQIGGAS